MTSWRMETRAACLVCWEDSDYSGIALSTSWSVGEAWSDPGNVQTPLLGDTPLAVINYSHLERLIRMCTQADECPAEPPLCLRPMAWLSSACSRQRHWGRKVGRAGLGAAMCSIQKKGNFWHWNRLLAAISCLNQEMWHHGHRGCSAGLGWGLF